MEKVIVSRHPATVEFIAQLCSESGENGYRITDDGVVIRDTYCGDTNVHTIPVFAQVTADQVRGKHVLGNLPLHLAAVAGQVTAVEFEGPPPRGQEYTVEDMRRSGAVLRDYVVFQASALEFQNRIGSAAQADGCVAPIDWIAAGKS